MPLLENVRSDASSPQSIATAMGLGKRLRKKAVLARSCFGFIGNRMLEPYVHEALFLLEDPAPINAYAELMLKERIGLVEAIEGGGFERALGYPFPGEANPMIRTLLDDARAARTSGQVKVILLIGMLCAKDKRVLRINGTSTIEDSISEFGILEQMAALDEVCSGMRQSVRALNVHLAACVTIDEQRYPLPGTW